MNNKSVNVSKFGFTYTKEHMSELSYGTRYIADPIIKELFVQNDYSNASSFINFGARHINHSQFGDFTSGNFGISLLSMKMFTHLILINPKTSRCNRFIWLWWQS